MSLYNKKLKLNVGYLHNLRNHEFLFLIHETVETARKFEIEESMVNAQLKLLEQERDIFLELKKAPKSVSMTEKIDEKFVAMRGLMMGIRNTVQAFLSLPEGDELRETAWMLDLRIQKVKKDLSSQAKTRSLYSAAYLCSIYHTEEDVRSAVEKLGLTVLFEQLDAYNTEAKSLIGKRTKNNARLENLRTDLRKRATFHLEMFLNLLQAAVTMNDEKSHHYYMLCTRIERAMISAVAIQKSRATRSKNKREEEEQQSKLIVAAAETSQETTTGTSEKNKESLSEDSAKSVSPEITDITMKNQAQPTNKNSKQWQKLLPPGKQ